MNLKFIFNFFYILLLIFLSISCTENIKNEEIIIKCTAPNDCEVYEDCKFISIDASIGECVKKLECNESYECDNNRDCILENDNKSCGRTGEFKVFTEEVTMMYLYEEYNYKIEVKNQQGEHYFRLIEGSNLPNGITLGHDGVLSGLPEDELGDYIFVVEVINAPMESNIFFNYIKTNKELKITLKDNDPCNYKCNNYQKCNIETQECIESDIPKDMVRIYMNDDAVYQGILIAEWNHNSWWWSNSDEYSYAIFDKEQFRNDGEDTSIKVFSSNDIKYIETSSSYLSIALYDEFLIKNDIVLSLPLKDKSFVIQGNDGYHLEEDGYGDFAYDFVKLDENANTYLNDGGLNSDYFVWGENLYLPIAGEIFEIHDNNNDNEFPGEYIDESEANMIGIKIKGNYYLYLLHLKKNSIPMLENNNCEENPDFSINPDAVECIYIGKKLKAGTYIGKVGNSGVSLVPHLHLTMFWYNIYYTDDTRMWSIPSVFKDIKVLNDISGLEMDHDFYRPKTGDELIQFF